jgi:hypothetical protein
MAKIDFSWDEDSNQDINTEETKELPSRKNLQFARRLFHMANGVTIATLYWLSFTHAQAIHTLGTFACLLYLMEQIRINYPEQAQKLNASNEIYYASRRAIKRVSNGSLCICSSA